MKNIRYRDSMDMPMKAVLVFTLFLMTFTVYLNTRVPKRENVQLKNKIDWLEKQITICRYGTERSNYFQSQWELKDEQSQISGEK